MSEMTEKNPSPPNQSENLIITHFSLQNYNHKSIPTLGSFVTLGCVLLTYWSLHRRGRATQEHICTQHTHGRVEMVEMVFLIVFLIVLDLMSLAWITGTQIRYEHCIFIFHLSAQCCKLSYYGHNSTFNCGIALQLGTFSLLLYRENKYLEKLKN